MKTLGSLCQAGPGLTVAGVCLLSVTAASPAAASCAAIEPASTEVPFVGEAVEVDGPYARFRVVAQGAAGPALAPEVWVLAGVEPQRWPWSLLGEGGRSSVDLTVVEGRRYAIGAFRRGEELSTSICGSSPLRAGDRAPAALLEREPVVGGLTGQPPPSSPWLVAGPIVAVVALGGAVTILVRHRRRRPV